MKKQEYVKLEGNDIEERIAAEERVLVHALGREKAEKVIEESHSVSLQEDLGMTDEEFENYLNKEFEDDEEIMEIIRDMDKVFEDTLKEYENKE